MRALVIGLLVVLPLTACTSTTNGQGSGGGSAVGSRSASAASTPDFPSSSPASPSSTELPSSAAPTPVGSSAANPLPSVAERSRSLSAQAPGKGLVLVRVPGGYEAATYDQSGGIQFWRAPLSSATWRQVGASSYPADPGLGPPDARVIGDLLRGMTHATFILRGLFTTDGGGNAVAFTTGGGHGWGTIKAEKNGNIGPSGAPVGSDRIGLSYDFDFAAGYLVTRDCPADRPLAECNDGTVITKQWRWTGTDFVLR